MWYLWFLGGALVAVVLTLLMISIYGAGINYGKRLAQKQSDDSGVK